MLRLLLLLALCCASVTLQGCAQLAQDRRDAPWDPKPGRSMMDQIPPWDSAASKICSGHLRQEDKKPGMSDRC